MKIKLAGCIIQNSKGEILFLHRKTSERNQWEIPGGKIDEGEKSIDTAKREVEEEIGTREIKVERHFDSFVSNIKIPPHNDGLILFVFRCMLKKPNQKIILNEESTEYKWTPAKEAKKLLTHKYPKSFIDKLDSI